MSVTLDNIQFYHGPSQPSKLPNSTFNRRSYCTGVFSSSESPFFPQPMSFPLTSRSAACRPNDQNRRQTADLPNVFDIELRNILEEDISPLANGAALEGPSCDSLPPFDLGHQEDFDKGLSLNQPFSAKADCVSEPSNTGSSRIPSSIRRSSNNPPLINTIPKAITRLGSADLISDANQSPEVEVVQQRQEMFPLRYSSNADECVQSDSSTSGCERSIETSPSSRSTSVASRSSKENSFPCLTSKYQKKENYGARQFTGKKAMHDSNRNSATSTLPSSPEPVTAERADTAETTDLQSLTRLKSLCISTESTTRPKNRRSKRKNEIEKRSKKSCQKEKYPSVAVVIPPLRSRTAQSARSNSHSVSSDVYLGGGSKRSDDSSGERFRNDSPQPGVSDREIIEIVDCRHTCSGTAASYKLQDSRDSLLGCHETSRDIVGQAVLTIDAEGSKPTFHLTLVPDNICSPTYLSTNSTHEIIAPSRKKKQSVTKSRSSQAKGKRRHYSLNEDFLLVKLKEQERLTWGEITAHFPGRKRSSLQVHYSTKLKNRSTG